MLVSRFALPFSGLGLGFDGRFFDLFGGGSGRWGFLGRRRGLFFGRNLFLVGQRRRYLGYARGALVALLVALPRLAGV